MTDRISRRSLAKGAAWAAPVVASTALVPAYAASMCPPIGVAFGGGPAYSFGEIGASRTDQGLTLGGRTWVYNLPTGVTVSSIEYVFWVQNRIGNESSGPGAFYVHHPSSSRKDQGLNAMPWTPTSGSGFAPTASSTVNQGMQGGTHTFMDGTVAPAWNLRMNWTADRYQTDPYSVDSSGCRTFDTGSSGRFGVTYRDVVATPSTTDSNAYVRAEAFVTIRLSDGRVLNYRSQTSVVYPR